MAHDDPRKWHMPGWKIEHKYSPHVLVGNWHEDRKQFLRDDRERATTTHRADFTHFEDHRPDVIIRRQGELKTEGIGKYFIFNHHENKYRDNLISLYDESYNRQGSGEDAPSKLRKWDQHSLSWRPEKSDHPLQGKPTNFGLAASKAHTTWRPTKYESGAERDFFTTYSSSYWPLPASARCQLRYATGRELSSHLLKRNVTNKHLQLRRSSNAQAPDLVESSKPRPIHADRMSSVMP